jgi:hypothetical protein
MISAQASNELAYVPHRATRRIPRKGIRIAKAGQVITALVMAAHALATLPRRQYTRAAVNHVSAATESRTRFDCASTSGISFGLIDWRR